MPTLPPDFALTDEGCHEPVPDDVVELSVLLPGWQLAALEQAADCAGITTAQMVRRLVQRFLRNKC
jgi:hypothetical protein